MEKNTNKKKKKYYQNLNTWWDVVFKAGFRKLAREYCIEKRREENEYRTFIGECMREAKERIDAGENLNKNT